MRPRRHGSSRSWTSEACTATIGWLWAAAAQTVEKIALKENVILKLLSIFPACQIPVSGRKPPSTMEPVFFHAGPWELQEEILLDFNIQAVNDLTAGVLS